MRYVRTNRPHTDQRGAIGTLILVWLAVIVVIGLATIDTSSIFLTRFRLADTASAAATQAANVYRSSHSESAACQAAVDSIAADSQGAELAKKDGCVVNPTTGQVTITVRKEAKTLVAGRLGFTKHFAKVLVTETNGPSTL